MFEEFSSIESNYNFNDQPPLDYLYIHYVVKTRDYQSPWSSSYRANLFPHLHRSSQCLIQINLLCRSGRL